MSKGTCSEGHGAEPQGADPWPRSTPISLHPQGPPGLLHLGSQDTPLPTPGGGRSHGPGPRSQQNQGLLLSRPQKLLW